MSHDQYGNPSYDPHGRSGSSAYGRDNEASNSWGDPVGQRSAGYSDEAVHGSQQPYAGAQPQGSAYGPQSQASAPYATPYAQSQPSGAYPHSQPSGAYDQSQAQGAYDQSQAQGQWQPAQPTAAGQPGQGGPGGTDDNFFKALMDFGFTRYATPSVIKVFYIVGIVLGGLYWIGGALMMMIAGGAASSYSSSSGSGALVGFLWLIFGAPLFFFYVIALRVQLEMMLAMVRTNQDTKAIRAKLEN